MTTEQLNKGNELEQQIRKVKNMILSYEDNSFLELSPINLTKIKNEVIAQYVENELDAINEECKKLVLPKLKNILSELELKFKNL